MYIYFDSTGVIKEVINDEAIRTGSDSANKICVYFEGEPTIDSIWYIIRKPDLTLTNEIEFSDGTVTEEIPYDKKRDMSYFKDYTKYKFYCFDLTSDVLTVDGLAYATIRSVADSVTTANGLVTFNIESNVINTASLITQSQYDYLIEQCGEFLGIEAEVATARGKYDNLGARLGAGDTTVSDLREYVDVQTGNGGTDVSSAVYIEPAYVATTTNLANIDSNAFDSELFDGLDIQDIVAEGSIRVLVKNQTIVSENGMYRMSDTGLMTKIEAESVEDIVVIIEYGNTQALKVYNCNADLSWTEVVEPGLPLQNQIDTVKGRITVNENNIDNVEGRLDIVEPIVTYNTNRVTAVEIRASTNATNIATNRADIDSNDIDIASNKARLTATELATSTNETNIATNSSNINLKEDKANKGVANGYAPLNESGVIDSAFVPNAYNDYIEVATYADLPTVGVASNLYIVKADETSGGDLSTYFWATDTYVPIHDTQSSTDIKVKYESNADTNAFTDSEKAKLLSLLTGSDYYSSSEVESRLNDLLTLGILQDTLIYAENGNDYISRLGTIPISYLSPYNWVYFKMTLSDDNVDHFGLFKQSEATSGALVRVNLANKIYGVLTNVGGVNAQFAVTDDANAEKVVNATCKFWGLKTTEFSADLISTTADESLSGTALTQQEANQEFAEELNSPFFISPSYNIYDYTEVTDGGLINANSGSLIVDATWCYSGYIPVDTGYISKLSTNNWHVAGYDADKNYVVGVAAGTKMTAEIISTVKYIIVSTYITLKENFMVVNDDTVPREYEAHTQPLLNDELVTYVLKDDFDNLATNYTKEKLDISAVTFTSGFYLDKDTIRENANLSYSDYIEIPTDQKYYLWTNFGQAVSFYDESYTYLNSAGVDNGIFAEIYLNRGTYIRFNMRNATSDSCYVFNKSNTLKISNDNLEDSTITKSKLAFNIDKESGEVSINTFDLNTQGAFIFGSSITHSSDGRNIYKLNLKGVSNFTIIEGLDTIGVSMGSIFSGSDTLINGNLVVGTLYEHEANDDGYVLLNYWGSESDLLIGYPRTIDVNYADYLYSVNEETSVKYNSCVEKAFSFSGSQAIFFGDSITEGFTSGSTTTTENYVKLFSGLANMTFNNKGVGGALITVGYNEVETIPTTLASVDITTLNTYPFLFIAGGVNDYALGVTESEFDTAVSNMCDYLNTNYTGKVIFITPINLLETRSASATLSLNLYRNILSEYALKNNYSLVCGNEFNFPTEDTVFNNLFFGDGLHPSLLGHKMYARSLATILL